MKNVYPSVYPRQKSNNKKSVLAGLYACYY
ncbi:MAG: hypothetical protein H6R13_678 [Proteobacteria bacterium]|nr:hypothetical protein [Pseudomonadota bacterium]